ncbi:MAG: AAA family ATPase [Myxococcales bacterium]|nr:AAA family ATPase [Myxococcales bacterium]
MKPARVTAPIELVPRDRAHRGNHQPSLVVLVGREEVLGQIDATLAGGARLLTVVGPPGIGKTRVVSACLDRLGPQYARKGGAFFCDLSQARTELDLLFAVASVVGDRSDLHLPHGELAARLAELLGQAGPALLVLDNFEQLIAAAHVVPALCRAAPQLRVLVTSRERLLVDGEIVIELPPLVCPSDATETSAVTLFLTRVREAGGVVEDRAAVAEIVRRLEGIPLAIELAAARTRVLSPTELARRLAEGHGVLAQVRRRVAGHQATLEGTLEWSWNLLTVDEQAALAACSVFAGPFSIAFAERVLGEGAVDLLGALRDKSLVHAEEGGRLGLYVSIREFAAGKLDAEREQVARLAHAEVYAEAARRFAVARSLQDDTPGGLPYAALRGEKENLVAALAFVRALPAPRLQAELAGALALLLALPGEQCAAELDAALLALPERDVEARAYALFARQGVHNSLGHYAACQADLETLRAMPVAPGLRVLALVFQGIQLRYQGFARRAWACHAEAEQELARLALPRLRAMNDACMGRLQCDFGDVAKARELNERAYGACEAVGDLWLGGLALANLAQLEQERQSFDRARSLLEQALARLRDAGEMHYEAIYASVCGDLLFELGELDDARRWYAHGARFLGRFLTHRQTAVLHAAAAALEARVGDDGAAQRHLAIARAGAAQVENPVVRLVVELHAESVELSRAGARERGALVERATTRLAALQREGDDAAIAAASLDVRFAMRMLTRTLEGAPSGACTLRVARGGLWFTVGPAERVDLGRRGALRRLLVALCERHTTDPDTGASVDALVAIGWPGERVLVEAAATRVRVAIATLRRHGLRQVLLTRDDGYLIDPAVRLEWS